MAAQPGNKLALKVKDPALRQEIYRDYCKNIAEGYPIYAWSYNKDGVSLCYKTMQTYIRENPDEFPTLLMNQAMAQRFTYWFNEGKKLMTGKYRNGSPEVWKTIMRNIFKDVGWDQIQQTTTFDPEILSHFSSVMKVVAAKQDEAQKADAQPIDITPAAKSPSS